MFKLRPDLEYDALAEEFTRNGRVSIPNFLEEECAHCLYENLRHRSDWLQIFNHGEQLIEQSRDNQAKMTDKQKSELDQLIYGNACYNFQYRYETIRITDEKEIRDVSTDLIVQFANWLSSDAQIDFLKMITGKTDILFADAQATAYSPGHFLTGHDDDFSGKNRRAAYVFGLTPIWRPEWGGLLLFHKNSNEAFPALVPDFNHLNLFAVPQMHSVTEVARSAAYRRYSITGWLRSGP